MPRLLPCLCAGLAIILAAAAAGRAGESAPPEPVAETKGLLAEMLKGPLAGTPEIVFAVRHIRGEHWYANFGYWVSNPKGYMYGAPGGRLCRLNLRTGQVTVIFEDPKGGVRDPCVSYDATKILFSYRPGDSTHYHLYEIGADGSGLRQLTDGDFDDIEPIYLPDGDLLFCSSRCNRWVQCWFTQVAILHRSDANGQNARPVSANIEQDNTPWVLPDGRILYMRWEYVDRSRVQFHHLWTINPDGTGQMAFYGNMHGGTVMLDAKPIPGTNKVASIFSPGHGQTEHEGTVAIVSPAAGPDARPSARQISPSGRGGDPTMSKWRDVYPISEDCFLVANDGKLFVMDGSGRFESIYAVPAGRNDLWAHEPRPLAPRPRERLIASRTDWSKATGRLILADVTQGRNMAGVRPGEVKKLLVLETLPKPVNFSGEMEPISLGGTFTLPRILGTVPVESDGSAYFEAPALRPIFLVALDEHDLSMKRMQSFVSVMPGETTSCVGCHEARGRTPVDGSAALLALRRPPSRIEPIADAPEVFDFPRDIQPILDKHCVACHSYEKLAGGVALTGDRGPTYSHSYAMLMTGRQGGRKQQVAHGQDAGGNRPPRSIGSSASPLLRLLDGSHYDARLSPREIKMVRLWIESGAPYAGTYASLGSGMVTVRADADVLSRRCGECHIPTAPAGKPPARWEFQRSDDYLFNLTRPEKSLLLLAPLAKEAGGLALCLSRSALDRNAAKRPAEPANVLAAKDDADYQKLLAGIAAMAKDLDRVKRFDMPGFRPNEHYLREMKRYGILPPDFDLAKDNVNPYEADERYWRSFWHQPAERAAALSR